MVVAEDCGSGSWTGIGTTEANRTRARITGLPPGVWCSFAVAAFRVVSGDSRVDGECEPGECRVHVVENFDQVVRRRIWD